ncbi:hypothetical protein EBR66_04045 [bacterium]|nr:hypothetical protein [bacterium]
MCLGVPLLAHTHEVYVLEKANILAALSAPSPNPFWAIQGNESLFATWGFISFVVIATVCAATFFRLFERQLDPALFRLKKYTLPVSRITVGLCFVAFAFSGNLYGSELFLSEAFADRAPVLQVLLGLMGVCAILGFNVRLLGVAMTALYGIALLLYGEYILTYTDYFGVALLLMLAGSGQYAIDSELPAYKIPVLDSIFRSLQPYAFALLRICFGWGVLYASVYAKFIHSNLALKVVNQYQLTRFFPFEPLFVVLGALIIEFICGLMIIAGVALRWTLLFLFFWLTLSLLYFQELIWPHGILFGLAIALFLHGYDRYSLEGFLLKKRLRESVL